VGRRPDPAAIPGAAKGRRPRMTLQMALAAIYPLIARLPELVELEKDRIKARSRRKPKPLRTKPATIGDLTRSGELMLEVHCGARPAGALYIDARQS
jgi:hypothetical protein